MNLATQSTPGQPKPAPAIHQRWGYGSQGKEVTLKRRMDGGYAYCEDGAKEDDYTHNGVCCFFTDWWFTQSDARYLGGPETPKTPLGVVVGQRYRRRYSDGWFDVIEVPWSKSVNMFLVRWDDGNEGVISVSDVGNYLADPTPMGPEKDLGASGSNDGIVPQKADGPKPLTARQILQARESYAAARRAETADVLATFVDAYDCLPDWPRTKS